MDGVILKSIGKDGNYLWQKTLEEDLGLTPAILDQMFVKEWHAITRGQLDLKEHLNIAFQQPSLKKLNLTAEKFIAYCCERDGNVNGGMMEIVHSLRVPAYLGTNQEKYRLEMIRERVGSSFHGIFASCEIGSVKPEAGFYRHIETMLNLNPDDLYLIDDKLANVNAAKDRGWKAYFYEGDLAALRAFLASKNLSH